jgi:hypothetical protein
MRSMTRVAKMGEISQVVLVFMGKVTLYKRATCIDADGPGKVDCISGNALIGLILLYLF